MKSNQIQTKIDGCNGLRVEIGGPTPDGYILLNEMGVTLPEDIIVTNISNPVVLNPFGANPQTYEVDEVVDVNHLPYSAGEVCMMLASSLPNNLHKTLFKNAAKVVCEGGLLIIENELSDDLHIAEKYGFKPLLTSEISSRRYTQIYELLSLG